MLARPRTLSKKRQRYSSVARRMYAYFWLGSPQPDGKGSFNNGICHFNIRVVLLVRWQSPVLKFMDFGVRIAPAMPVSVFCLLPSDRSRSRLFRQEERQNFSMSRFGISIGEYPKGYDAKIHGPYNPAVNYGKGTKWQRMKLYLTCC